MGGNALVPSSPVVTLFHSKLTSLYFPEFQGVAYWWTFYLPSWSCQAFSQLSSNETSKAATYSTFLEMHPFTSRSHVDRCNLILFPYFFIQLLISALTSHSQAALQLPVMFIRDRPPSQSQSSLNSYYILLSLLLAFFQPCIFLQFFLIKKAYLHDSKGQIYALHRKISFNQDA